MLLLYNFIARVVSFRLNAMIVCARAVCCILGSSFAFHRDVATTGSPYVCILYHAITAAQGPSVCLKLSALL